MTLPLEGYADAMLAKKPGDQGSVEWLQERVGHCTASRFKDVMDYTKGGKEGAKRAAYRMELVVERITGKPAEHFVSDAMAWGTNTEPMARMAYESHTGLMVSQVGFRHHPTIKMVGGSPDGLVDDDGGLEIKCPTTATHIKTILSGECDHLPQIQGLMWITGRQWWDFVSYDPRLPDGLQLYVQRIKRDDDYIAELSKQVIGFLADVAEMSGKLLSMVKPFAHPTEPELPPLEL